MRRALGLLACALATLGARADEHDGLLEIFARLGAPWTRIDTPYVEIVAADRSLIDAAGIAQLNGFVSAMIDRLEIDAELERQLRAHRLRYLLCARPEDVALFTGIDAAGVALLRQRLIVSSHFPHEHELVHLLSSLAIGESPATTPELVANDAVLQEGLAGYLGGRSGISSLALRQSAEFHLRQLPIDPSRFFGQSEIALRGAADEYFYAASTRFVEFLVDQWGMSRFLALYRTLACPRAELQRRPPAHVVLQLEGHYGMSWNDLRERYLEWRRQHSPRGPQLCAAPEREPDLALALDRRSVEIWDMGENWVLRVRAEDGYPEVQLAFGEALDAAARARQADLPAGARRYALRLLPYFVELQDRAQDRLLSHGRLQPHLPEWESAPPREYTLCVPREQLQDFGRADELTMWAVPRLRPPQPERNEH